MPRRSTSKRQRSLEQRCSWNAAHELHWATPTDGAPTSFTARRSPARCRSSMASGASRAANSTRRDLATASAAVIWRREAAPLEHRGVDRPGEHRERLESRAAELLGERLGRSIRNPHFAALYAVCRAVPTVAEMLATFTMRPCPAASIAGRNARVMRNVPVRLMRRTASQSPSVVFLGLRAADDAGVVDDDRWGAEARRGSRAQPPPRPVPSPRRRTAVAWATAPGELRAAYAQATSSSSERVLASRATDTPRRPRASATARPIPRPAPVTTAYPRDGAVSLTRAAPPPPGDRLPRVPRPRRRRTNANVSAIVPCFVLGLRARSRSRG